MPPFALRCQNKTKVGLKNKGEVRSFIYSHRQNKTKVGLKKVNEMVVTMMDEVRIRLR